MANTTFPPPPLDLAAPARVLLARAGEALLDWRLLLAPLIALAGLLLAAQFPLSYAFQIGIDRGPNTDLPFLSGFRGPELTSWDYSWRWSEPEATISVPGVGRRPLLVSFDLLSHRRHWQPGAAQPLLTVDYGVGPPLTIPLRYEVTRYQILVPAAAVRDGTLSLQLATEGWLNPDDERGPLGIALGRLFRIEAPGGPAWPDVDLLLAYPAALALCWVALRVLGVMPGQSLAVQFGLLAGLLPLAVIMPPRLAVSAGWAISAGLLALGCAAFCALLTPPLLSRLGVHPGPHLLPWLLLLLVLTFVAKYGGQFHPVAMPGDIQLHINRFGFTVDGQVYIPAQHRGLPFPFPSGWYLLVAPLTLSGAPLAAIFELTAGLAEVASVLLFYLLLARITGSARGGFIGALIATISPIPMMNVWWSFQTQVGSQLLTLLLLTLIILHWPDYKAPLVWGGICALLILVSLGHIGAFINTGLVGLAAIPWLWLRARTPEERAGVRQLLRAGLLAAAFVVLFYYSSFAGLIIEQAGSVAQGGLLGATERAPVPREVWLRALWAEGVLGLNGFFLMLFGLLGALIITRAPRYSRGVLPPLIWLTFAVALTQAILPLITLSTITTRWLTFAGWALTVGATIVVEALWRRGPAGRAVAVASLAFVAWVTLLVWLGAMAINQPPLEPF